MNIDLNSKYVVRDADDNADVDATVERFRGDLNRFLATRETEDGHIEAQVHALFDARPGVRMNMPYVVNQVLSALKVQPENYNVLSERIREYVRANGQGENVTTTDENGKEVSTVERPESTFLIGKGIGGGVGRRADLPPPAPKKTSTKKSA